MDESIDRIGELEQFDIELIEQPIKPGDYEGLRKIRESVNTPIMADEDAVTSKELPALAGCGFPAGAGFRPGTWSGAEYGE